MNAITYNVIIFYGSSIVYTTIKTYALDYKRFIRKALDRVLPMIPTSDCDQFSVHFYCAHPSRLSLRTLQNLHLLPLNQKICFSVRGRFCHVSFRDNLFYAWSSDKDFSIALH